jgi:hypothetical protein
MGREPILRKAGRRIITKPLLFFTVMRTLAELFQPQYLGHIYHENSVER